MVALTTNLDHTYLLAVLFRLPFCTFLYSFSLNMINLCAGWIDETKKWGTVLTVLVYERDHSFSIYAKFSEKLTFLTPRYAFLTPWYAVRVRIRGQEILVFRKILRTSPAGDSQVAKGLSLRTQRTTLVKILWIKTDISEQSRQHSTVGFFETVWKLFKINNKDTRWRYWPCSGVFIVNFEQILHIILVFSLLTLNK